MSIKTVTLGTGAVVIGHGVAYGAPSVFIEPAPKAGPIGGDASDSGIPMDAVVNGGVVLRFTKRASAQVMLDAILETLGLFGDAEDIDAMKATLPNERGEAN